MNIKGISHLSLRVTHLLCCMTMAPHGLPCLQVVDFRPTNTFTWPVPLLWVVFISIGLYVLFQCYIQCTCGLYLYYLPVGRESNPLSCISFKKSSVIYYKVAVRVFQQNTLTCILDARLTICPPTILEEEVGLQPTRRCYTTTTYFQDKFLSN